MKLLFNVKHFVFEIKKSKIEQQLIMKKQKQKQMYICLVSLQKRQFVSRNYFATGLFAVRCV